MYQRFKDFWNTPQMRVNRSNKLFWTSFISALILLLQAVLSPFGVELSFLNDYLHVVLNAVFGVLTILGVYQVASSDNKGGN